MIRTMVISDDEFSNLFRDFEKTMDFVPNLDIPIKLNCYGYFLRLALNMLKSDDFEYLLSRLENNKELEHNEGNYSLGFLFGNNPKIALSNLIKHLQSFLPKTNQLVDYLSNVDHPDRYLVIADQNECEFLESMLHKYGYTILTHRELVRGLNHQDYKTKHLVFYSFNGKKDFDFIHGLPNEITLFLYEQEVVLYKKQQQIYKRELEQELTSDERFMLCGIKYNPIKEEELEESATLENIIRRIDERSNTAYNGYKGEGDSLLDDLEEKVLYNITFASKESISLESNESVFDTNGNLIKTYKLKEGIQIRIYPKDQLAENLLQIAIESEPEVFGKVQEHADLWLNSLKQLDETYSDRELLYRRLKEKGLRVLPLTVDAYFRGNRKYPMYNSDLLAILTLRGNESSFDQIKKSKRLYNSTMIALGRGLKQELRQFLKYKTLGEILNKRNFSEETLSKFITEQMPLQTIIEIKVVNNECD